MQEKPDPIVTTILNVIEYPPILDLGGKLLVIYPTKEDYELTLRIMIELRKVGTPVNVVDVVLASIAINRNMVVVSNDKDFEFIKKVDNRLEIQSES
ncbi:hypothetical protein [Metallosphaera hakonensis]|uniref:PIN domain-containing protein n=1 Tax=Metallosphaera hakonensis JCM 8857 = DSM 7519 TaxID=1293036 RepID=A0A2U9IQQ3_9CREN|nr:hypothetical protein [Metallosphaera hakonensis]